MRNLILCIVSVAAVTFAAEAQAASQGTYLEEGAILCGFAGEITRADVEQFKRNLARNCATLNISSPGGDVAAAMEIGRAVRARKLAVVVPSDGACSSSCVLVYAAGVERLPFGPVQIHRPYLPASEDSFEVIQKNYDSLSKAMRAYLRSLNVNERLYQMMMDVDPKDVRQLTMQEMADMGMGEVDPVYQEFLDSRHAKKIGMVKGDYLSAKARAMAVCGPIEGILMPEAMARVEATRACWRREFPQYLRETP